MPVTENFWPDLSLPRLASEPAAILQEQAEALADKTQGDLVGTVEQSEVPPIGEAAYDLYINVNEKPYRYLLLSVQHGLQSNYPVRISNTLAGTLTQVHDSEAFKRQLRQIFHAPPTVELLGRMRSLTAQP